MSGQGAAARPGGTHARRAFRQFIPRPPTVVPGGPAPWATVDPADRLPIPLDRVVANLRPHLAPELGLRGSHQPHAAVLVGFFEHEGDTRVVLIRRSFLLLTNPGDLAFPGGRLEHGETATEAALRETYEEVRIPPAAVSVLGRLSLVHRARRAERVAPVVGVLETEPHMRPDPLEVDAAFTVALSDLAAGGVYWEEEWHLPGELPRFLPFFASETVLGDDVLWGMTAMVLRAVLVAVLRPDLA